MHHLESRHAPQQQQQPDASRIPVDSVHIL
jgi:hypothetical protein